MNPNQNIPTPVPSPLPTQGPTPTPPQPGGSAKSTWMILIVTFGLIALIIVGIGFGINALMNMRGGNDRDIISKGLTTEGISGTYVYEGPKKVGRSVQTVYNASYRYTVDGEQYSVFGEKDYKSRDNVKEGMNATVHYLPDDPEEATVTNEQ